MGRPALLGRHPRDRGTEGSEDPPTTATAPGGAITSIVPNKKRIPQKMLTQLLAGPICLQGLQTVLAEDKGTPKAYNIRTSSTTSLTKPSTWQPLEDRCQGGAHAEGG